MHDCGLGDSWRMRNPSLREYSYFSPLYQSSSRIDFFLVSNSLTHIKENTIHPIMISDHAPVSLAINTQTHIKPPTRWRLNTSLLEDPDFDSLIRREWASFLEMNDSPEISPSLLWETGKAVLRGKIISYSSYKKKQQQQLENTLEQKILQLTNHYTNNPSDQIQKELKEAKTQLESIIHKKTQFLIQQLKYENFQYSNKPSKFLANMLQRKKEKAIIPSIINSTGSITQNPQEINDTFQKFYSNLLLLRP